MTSAYLVSIPGALKCPNSSCGAGKPREPASCKGGPTLDPWDLEIKNRLALGAKNERLLRLNIELQASKPMGSEEPIELEGTVSTVLPGTMFRVKLDNQHEVLAHLSGKMRKHFVRLTVGDRVRLEMSPYDLSKARITYRLR
jgi:translation initiation factor IF-1